jgi:hypothetical protein
MMDDHGIQAERALLGAVLLDPAGQQHVLDLVRREDMDRPYHGQVLAAMQRLRERAQIPGPLQVYEEVKNDTDLPRSVSHDGVLLAVLMEAAPRPSHAPAYAAMVIDAGIRRQLSLAGSRMAQAAGDDGADLETALQVAGLARRELDACRARWGSLPERMRRELPVPRREDQDLAEIARRAQGIRDEIDRLRQDLWAETSHGAGERLASIDRQLAETTTARAGHREQQAQQRAAGQARPQGDVAEAAGARAVRELAAGPASQIAEVARWLQPTHFACPAHGELYAVIRDLHAAGMPTDPVTIGREAARRGIRAETADLAGGMGPLGVAAAREVHQYGLLAQIAQAGRDIQADTADPVLSPRLLIRSAAGRLNAVERESRAGYQGRPAQPSRQQDATVISTTGPSGSGPGSREPDREAIR